MKAQHFLTHMHLIELPRYLRQKLIELQREIDDESSIIIGNFNTSLLEMERSNRQKIVRTKKKADYYKEGPEVTI